MSEHAAEAAHHSGEAAHHAGAGVKGVLGRKLGPMPVGGWVLAVGAGVAIALYFRNKGTTDPTTPDPTTLPDLPMFPADPGGTQAGVGGSAGGGGSSSGGGGVVHHHNPTEAEQARAATTNAAWATHAVAAMVPFGFDAHHVANALDAYLTGHKLTQAQEVAVAATQARCGPPPHPPKHQPGPGVPPPPPPPHHHHHRHDNGTTPPTKPTATK